MMRVKINNFNFNIGDKTTSIILSEHVKLSGLAKAVTKIVKKECLIPI